jgi:Ca-activated chloride channel family protein
MKFALPDFLWLLLLTPLAGWLLWQAARQRQKLMASFVHPRLLESLTAGLSPVRRRIRYVCLLAALALLAIAIARPQWGFQWEEVKQRGLDIVVAIDTSRSMLAEDIKPNRLERAKLAALDLVQQARSDRVGLIAFAGTAFMQCPLTLDDEAFRQSVTMLDTEIIPQTGTAIAEAVQVARAAFTNENENYKVLILFTDGEDHEQGVIEAAEEAAKAGLKIFTVGVGTPEGEVLRSSDTRGRNAPLKDEEGKTIHSKLDERLLSRLATTTGGFYQRLTGAHTIETLYEKGLAPLPKVDYSARLVRQYYERFHWPLGLAILLLMVEILLPDRAM